MRHEIVAANTDIEARFYLSVDEGSFVTPHWHNSLEMVYMLEGSMESQDAGASGRCGAGEFQSDSLGAKQPE